MSVVNNEACIDRPPKVYRDGFYQLFKEEINDVFSLKNKGFQLNRHQNGLNF